MASVKQIAEHLDISSATVSRVLNARPGIAAETRRRVLDAARTLGVQRDVGLKSSRYIGFVHPLGQLNGALGDYHAAMVGGMASTLGQNQFDVALVDPYRDKRTDESFTQFFMRKDLLGLVLQVRPHNAHVVAAIAEEGFPCVLIASKHEQPSASWIVVDSASVYRDAIDHLCDLGHRHLGLVSRTDGDFDHDERVRGFDEAVAARGLDEGPVLRWSCAATKSAGASIVRRWATLPDRPTALLFTDVAPTRGAIHACAQLGLSTPGDLSIVGFDDTDRRFDTLPAYTSVCQDAQRLGREAATIITRLIAGPRDEPIRLVLPASYEVHGTTGPPR